MRKNVQEDPSYEARNAALDLKDPMGSVDCGDGSEETLGSTLQDICGYIHECLQWSANPLTHLRRYFPKYDWAFHRPKTKEETAKIVSKADYTLPEATGFTDWSMGMFTVTHKTSQSKKKICFCVASNTGPDLNCWPYEELEKVGAKVIINDPDATLDPEYGLMIVSPLEALKYKIEQRKKILGK